MFLFAPEIFGLLKPSVTYLGDSFSYHNFAANYYFGENIDLVAEKSFDAMVKNVQNQITDFCVIAIDNTVAGDVPGNLERVIRSGLVICGEIYLHINFHLAADQPLEIEKIKTIYSHEMAIKETKKFFAPYPLIRFVETSSTAGGIKKIAEEKPVDSAAIGNRKAIEHYGLTIIAKDIDDTPENYTRFLMLCNENNDSKTTFHRPKASILLQHYDDFENELNGPVIFKRNLRVDGNDVLYAELLISDPDQFNDKIRNFAGKYKLLGIYETGKKLTGI